MKAKGRQLTTVDLFLVLKRALLLVLVCTLLGGAAGYYIALRRTKVTYTASSDVYVQASTVDMEVGQTANEIALGRALALSCRDATKNDALYNNVKKYFAARQDENWPDISQMNNDIMGAMISTSVTSNSQIVTITVTSSDSKLAICMANAIAAEMEASVIDVIGICRIEPTKWAYTASSSSTFSITPALAGALFGAFVAYAVMLLCYIFDPCLRNKKELEELLGDTMPLLGTVHAENTKGGRV